MIRILAFAFCSLFITSAYAQREIIYRVQVRSFFDTNGDGHGDLKGVEQKLDYLQQLGVTSVALSPIYQSDFYHNLYGTEHQKPDEKYGKFKEYRDLIQNIHRRKMKLYQEIDLQYVGNNHIWFKDSFKNTKSDYSGYIYYTDKNNQKPFGKGEVTAYNGTKLQAVAVNLKNTKVKEHYAKMLKYWTDPDGDGNFYDGVDGFFFADVKDRLDNSGKTNGQLKDFYTPLFAGLKKQNPNIKIIAEPGNSYGKDLLNAGADAVTASKLREAILSFDKNRITQAADSTLTVSDTTRYAIGYLENGQTIRIASQPGMNIGKLRVAAGLGFFLAQVPEVYYGQEIGMQGKPLQTGTDGDNIPMQEAFEWYAAESGLGTAVWYKDSGKWWDSRNAKASDGISLEEQEKDANSLWGFYKQLARAKRMQPALALGNYMPIKNDNGKVLSFIKIYINKEKAIYERALIVVNLSGETQEVQLIDENLKLGSYKLLIGTPNSNFQAGKGPGLTMTPYAFQVWKI